MTEFAFCPFCDAPAHKTISIKDSLKYCKECQKFFSLSIEKLKCPKCNHDEISHSDFPMPSGEMVFQCHKCKKIFSLREVIAYNNIAKTE